MAISNFWMNHRFFSIIQLNQLENNINSFVNLTDPIAAFNISFQHYTQCLSVLWGSWTNLSFESIIFKEWVETVRRYQEMIQLWIPLIWLHQPSSQWFNDLFETRYRCPICEYVILWGQSFLVNQLNRFTNNIN